MNKKDLASLRKGLNLNSYLMSIKELYSVYLKRDNGEIITKEFNYFEMMDVEERELYLENFKKILTGAIDTKIFELDFKADKGLENTQDLLSTAIYSGESIINYADKLVEKISNYYTYDTDVVINFMKAEYYKANKKGEESENESVQAIEFIVCSINKVDTPKKALQFDYEAMKFKSNSRLDNTINLNSPLDGFMFPSFNDDYVDTNKILYHSSKSNQINSTFIEKVLDCEIKSTAAEEKESFNAILNAVIGDKIKPETMQEIYESILEKFKNQESQDEEPVINIKSLKGILEYCDLETISNVESAFEQICGGDYDFKIKNIIPDFYSKSIIIESEYTRIKIAPDKLNSMKQIINEEGKKCLLVELNEDVELNGFRIETEM